ncbi:MAG: 16S rRNA (guanine(966)-N(2))-methyltransferase RsmD [Treponema sp.]|nr:MAG: 16S rRNA (guanine(966)-N(2))-methyltransferase RsmD [Treponema sp.]
MRITGGKLQGLHTECPKGVIRPSMDRVRETVFAVLGDLSGMSFLDLFAGSGTCALEAYSRGAYPVWLIEKDKLKINTIIKNLALADDRLECKNISAELFLKRTKKSFDIINADPPYKYNHYTELLKTASNSKGLKPQGLFLLHRPKEKDAGEKIEKMKRIDRRIFGRTIVDFYIKEI